MMLFSILGTSVQMKQNMLQDLDQVPETVRKMMGEGFAQSILKYGIIMVGYIHPFSLIMFILFIFMAVSQVVTSEITFGTIGFTLSKPISRKRLFLNLGIVIYTGLASIALFAFLSTYLGIMLFHKDKFSAAPFANIAWNLFLLMIFVAGYVVIFAAFSETSKKMYTYGGITLFALYLLSFAAPLWKPLEYISPASPFTYYKPMAILMGSRIGWSTSLSLIVVSLAMFTVAAVIFNRRDIAGG
jgi:ABC-type transport system involved in multi-copper enzyme maturation permease subunit